MPANRQGSTSAARRERRRVVRLEPIPAGRMKVVFILLCAGLLGLIGRMAWLQIFQASELEARARVVQTQRTKPLGSRRPIVDRNGRLVALDEERYRLWAHPRYFNFPGDEFNLIRDRTEVADLLSPVLALSSAELNLRINRESGIKLVEELTLKQQQRSQLRISGIEPYPHRVYPQGSLFDNVVGFLNQEREPQAGLSRDDDLQRHEQSRVCVEELMELRSQMI